MHYSWASEDSIERHRALRVNGIEDHTADHEHRCRHTRREPRVDTAHSDGQTGLSRGVRALPHQKLFASFTPPLTSNITCYTGVRAYSIIDV